MICCSTIAVSFLPFVLFASFFRWCPVVVSFAPVIVSTRRLYRQVVIDSSVNSSNDDTKQPSSVDVSDLGLTIHDLQKPIPSELLGGDFKVLGSGTQSTSRIPSIDDGGCRWEESLDLIGVTLSVEGLRGQPVAAMDVVFSTTTCTVNVFGYAIWSCVLKGECVPESALTKVEDGYDMTPLITLSVAKKKDSDDIADSPWDGFIGSIGEDSIL